MLLGSKSNLQSVGLIILLVSKAAGFDPQRFTPDQYDSGVLHSQRALAEIVEMKRTGHLIHKAMCNLQEKEKRADKFKDLLYGNKIVLLTGINNVINNLRIQIGFPTVGRKYIPTQVCDSGL